MGGRLVGENVGYHAAIGELGNDIGAISYQSDRNIFFFANSIFQNAQCLVEGCDHEVAIACLKALLNAFGIDINSEECRAGHGCRERLGAAHASHAAANDQLAGEISAKMFFACS